MWTLHMFYTYIASVYSECFSYFRCMLHEVLYVAIVSCFMLILLDRTAEVTWRASAGRARGFLCVCTQNIVGVGGPRTRVGNIGAWVVPACVRAGARAGRVARAVRVVPMCEYEWTRHVTRSRRGRPNACICPDI
jgi:hypothetical protein